VSAAFTIGVAVPAYSRPELLTQLLATIPGTHPVFVSDNNKSLRGSALALGSNTVLSHSEVLIPMFANWNRALAMVTGDVTHVLVPSDDDLYLPQAFDHLAGAIGDHPDADIFIFGCDLVDEVGHRRPGYVPEQLEVLEDGRGFWKFEHGVDARMPGVMFRKAFLDRIGAFDEQFQLTAADSDLIQRALLQGKAVFVPQVVGLYRVWAGSLTHSRLATAEWMREIDLWTDKIIRLIESGHRPAGAPLNLARYKAEIVARNLLAGVAGLIARHEYQAVLSFMAQQKVPAAAKLRTKFSLARRRLLAWRHAVA
jgi:hypothetical protein